MLFKIATQEEYQRLLYVTLTRAQKILCIPDTSQLYSRQTDSSFAALAQWQTLPSHTFSEIISYNPKISHPPLSIPSQIEDSKNLILNQKFSQTPFKPPIKPALNPAAPAFWPNPDCRPDCKLPCIPNRPFCSPAANPLIWLASAFC